MELGCAVILQGCSHVALSFEIDLPVAVDEAEDRTITIDTNAAEHFAMRQPAKWRKKFKGEGDIGV